MDASHELAAFLRTRRKRLTPAEAGLPQRPRRRTPGLRREEVAELADISVDYLIRLEQGRGSRPSPDVLGALARALRLSDDERAHLFDLARHRPPVRRGRVRDGAPASLARLVHALSPLPAMVLNPRFDILAWNPEMAGLMVDFEALPPEDRNIIRLCMLHPALRDFYRDRERVVREAIAGLRAVWAANPDDQALAGLVGELALQSQEFRRLWALNDVKILGRGQKRLVHPNAGALTIEFEVLTPLQDPDLRLIVYRATDQASQAALDKIVRVVAGAPALQVVGEP